MLRSFVEVSRRASFTLAATSLHLTQAAVSTQIRVLEESIGLQLLDRSERPLQLTEAGRVFFQFAEETLNRAENMGNFFKELVGGVAGQVRIGASLSVGTYILPRVIGKILKEYPKVKMDLFTHNREIVCDAVSQSRVDFGIVLTDKLPENLQATPLRFEPFYVVAAANHPLTRKRNVAIKDLQSIPFVVGMSNEYTEMVNRMMRSVGIMSYTIGFRINNLRAGRSALVRVCLLSVL